MMESIRGYDNWKTSEPDPKFKCETCDVGFVSEDGLKEVQWDEPLDGHPTDHYKLYVCETCLDDILDECKDSGATNVMVDGMRQ